MRTGAVTKDYVTLCQAGGKNRKEIVRCLKRHIARRSLLPLLARMSSLGLKL